MIDKLLSDGKKYPNAIWWFGAIDGIELEKWITDKKLNVPSDLKQLWIQTGGGELFESEYILSPFPYRVYSDFDDENQKYQSLGM